MRRLVALALLALLAATPVADAVVHGASTSIASAKAASITGTRPSGTLAGHLLLAQVVADSGSDLTLTPPSGWTLVRRTNLSTTLTSAVYLRWAGAAEPDTYRWNASPSSKLAVGITRYADVDPTTPIDAAAVSASANAPTLTAPSVTTTSPNALLVVLAASVRATSFTPATGMTERYDVGTSVTAQAADETIAAAGATGTRTVTVANSGNGIVTALALRTAPAKVVSMETASFSGLESAGTARFGAKLNLASTLPVQVDYAVGGTATGGGVDHALAAGTLTFSPGQTYVGINASLVSDTAIEPDETIVVTLSNPRNATLGAVSASTFTILNDDTTVGFANATLSVAETAGSARVFVTLGVPSARPVSVAYAATGGTAVSGADYTLAAGTLAFAAGEVSRSFDVAILDDAAREPGETITLQLSAPVNATVTTASATLTILDNEPIPTVGLVSAASSGSELLTAPTLALTLSGPTYESVSVAYGIALGSAGAGDAVAGTGSATIAPGATSASIPLAVTNDAIDEEDETLVVALTGASGASLGLAQATYTILDDDAAPTIAFAGSTASAMETGAAQTSVALSGPSGKPVTVLVAPAGGSADASDFALAPTTLTIAPGATSASLAIPLVDDAVQESDETIQLALSGPTNATLGAPATQTLVILDDEAPVSVRFAAADQSVAETAGSASVAVVLSGASSMPIEVGYAVAGGSAGAADFVLAPGRLAFAPGQTRLDVAVALLDDETPEGAETILLALADPSNATLAAGSHAITIVDDDPAFPLAQFASGASEAAETSGYVDVVVTLSFPSTRALSVGYDVVGGTATGGGADYALAAGTLSFAPGETARAIRVALVDDAAVEVAETVVVALRDPTRATLGPATTHTLTITSEDLPPVVAAFRAASSAASEAARGASVAVDLSRASASTITIAYAATDAGARGGGVDYALSPGVLVFPPGETSRTISVEITDDGDIEADEGIVLALSSPSGATLGTPATHALSIVSDDTAALTAQFATSAGNGPEGSSPATIALTLSASSGADIEVGISVAGGTATAGADYVAPSARVAFPAGTTTVAVAIDIVQDAAYEGDETIVLVLSEPVGAVLGATTTFTYTILEDDPAPQRALAVAAAPVLADGTPDPATSWGGWVAEAGQTNVASTNYLKITNTGGVPNPSVVVSFSSAFVGAVDAAASIPVAGNVQFAWWEDTTPGSSSPSEGAYSFLPASAGGAVTLSFTGTGNVVYVAYRVVQMPDVLPTQAYRSSFTVTEL